MLASLFSKTKPINYVILTILLVFTFVSYQFYNQKVPSTGYEIFKTVTTLGFLVLSLILTQFIVQKNRLVKDNAYVPLLYVSFLIMFPTTLLNVKVVIANFFILLALRRLFSLHSLKSPQEKLFDASLWILVAALFHFWSLFFLVLLFFAVAFYVGRDYRNWFIPVIALLAVFIFLSIYLILVGETYSEWIQSKIAISLDFTNFSNVYENIALAVFTSIALLFFFTEVVNLKSKQFNMQSSYKKIIIAFLIGVAVYVVSEDKNNGSILFTFFPLAVLGSNYIEIIPQKWRKEFVVYGVLGLSFFFYFSQLFL